MAHRYHPDTATNDPPEALVYDDCERCDHSAERPYMLDDDRLRRAYLRMLGDDWEGTKNERKLFTLLYLIRLVNERLALLGLLE